MDSSTYNWVSFFENLINDPQEAHKEIARLEKSNPEIAEIAGNLDDFLHKHYIRRQLFEETISKANNVVLQFALQNYAQILPITNEDDLLDSFLTSLNMLGEELNYSTITSHYLLDIFNSYPDLIIITDELGIIQNANKKVLILLGQSKKEIIKTNLIDLFVEQLTFDDIEQMSQTNKTIHFRLTNKSSIGMSVRTSPLIRKNNHKAGVVFVFNETHQENMINNQKNSSDINTVEK
ncbi:MAG: hypothetical protein CVU05_06880 [Bacteroidetes bacterium HGW-Bacteroidetes-21]|jgi:PAS domain S-box-containing protein|nr:MAG: hypothetical protein CVU05_06880 [Bacteroidetes bacterium HGW-Bacteroidetes-21]